jgi:hypothetical protein
MKKYFQNGVVGENFKWNLCVNFIFIAYYDINFILFIFRQKWLIPSVLSPLSIMFPTKVSSAHVPPLLIVYLQFMKCLPCNWLLISLIKSITYKWTNLHQVFFYDRHYGHIYFPSRCNCNIKKQWIYFHRQFLKKKWVN